MRLDTSRVDGWRGETLTVETSEGKRRATSSGGRGVAHGRMPPTASSLRPVVVNGNRARPGASSRKVHAQQNQHDAGARGVCGARIQGCALITSQRAASQEMKYSGAVKERGLAVEQQKTEWTVASIEENRRHVGSGVRVSVGRKAIHLRRKYGSLWRLEPVQWKGRRAWSLCSEWSSSLEPVQR